SQNRGAAGVLFIIMRSMPVKFSERSVNNQIIRGSDFEAKINVGDRARQAFVKSPSRLENLTPRQHACARYGAAIASYLQLPIRPGMFRRETVKRRLR